MAELENAFAFLINLHPLTARSGVNALYQAACQEPRVAPFKLRHPADRFLDKIISRLQRWRREQDLTPRPHRFESDLAITVPFRPLDGLSNPVQHGFVRHHKKRNPTV